MKAAELGDGDAAYSISCFYQSGFVLDENPELHFYWTEKCAQLGNPLAMTNLSNCYLNGYGVDKSIEQGKKWLYAAVEKKDPMALNNLAWAYQIGKYGPVDISQAIELYKESSDLGCSRAMNNLGALYDERGEYQDAIKYYLMAAEAGEPMANQNLAFMYYLGRGCSKDEEKAIEFLIKEKNRGEKWKYLSFLLGCSILKEAILLLDSDGNSEKGAYLLKLAQQVGVPGAYLYTSRRGQRFVTTEGDYILNQASALGGDLSYEEQTLKRVYAFNSVAIKETWNEEDAEDVKDLGLLYYFGLHGAERDLSKAYEQFERAAAMGDLDAHYWCGYFIEKGIGQAADPSRARNQYSKVLSDHPEATYRYARLSEELAMRRQDEIISILDRVAIENQPGAEKYQHFNYWFGRQRMWVGSSYRSLARLGSIQLERKDIGAALESLTRAASWGSSEAARELAYYYSSLGKQDEYSYYSNLSLYLSGVVEDSKDEFCSINSDDNAIENLIKKDNDMEMSEMIKVCSVCKNRKMDMKVGLVCSLTGMKPSFSNHCVSYVEDQEAISDKEKRDREIAESKKEVSGVTAFILHFSIGLGLIMSLVSTGVTVYRFGVGNIVSIYLLVYMLMFAYVGISAIIGFHRHWSNSVSLAFTYCAMLAVDSIMALVLGAGGMKNLVLAAAFSAFFYFSEDIRFKYPKEYRTWKLPEKIILGVQVVMTLLVLVGNLV